jgi:hypothetical protein
LIAFLQVGGDFVLAMDVIPSDDRSAISVKSWDELSGRGLIPRNVTAEHCPLCSLKLSDQPIPDLDVRIDPSLRDVEGVLGLDVFEHYDDRGFDRALPGYILRK